VKEPHRILALDGWRAIGALMVIISHLFYGSIDWLGWLGVQIFFVISGYIISAGFLREEMHFSDISLSGFYVRRAFRILPPLALYVAVIVALASTEAVPAHSMRAAYSLLFVCDLRNANCGGWLGAHTWSLSVEEQFYAVIPILFIWLGSKRRAALTLSAFSMPIFVIVLFFFKFTETAKFLSQFLAIGWGVACALNESTVQKIISRMPSGSLGMLILAILLVASQSGSRFATILNAIALSPLLVFLLMRTLTTPSLLSRILSSAPFASLGLASYSLYLWQQLAVWPAVAHGNLVLAIAALSVCVVFCFASYFLFERPFIRRGRKLAATMRVHF
jgi:peptidoglycan/LPS O-acetylase OafA/YrhL